jgi:cytochrome b6-f complex iron-sulfur subunit
MAELDRGRRSFLSRLLAGLGIVAGLQAAWITVSMLGSRRPPVAPDDGGLLEAGPVGRFAPGSVTPFPEAEFYLARLENGGFLALHRKCTHLGCSVPWRPDEERFACPCHASAFDIRGAVLNSPAPRPLDLFAVEIVGGVVHVDTAKRIRRSSFEPEQVVGAGVDG